MIFVFLSKELINDAELLSKLEPDVFSQFLIFALNNINGQQSSSKVYQRVGSSLGVDGEVIQKAIFALASVLVECSKKNADVESFKSTIYDLELSEENRELLTKAYIENTQKLRRDLSRISLQQVTYKSIDWRLDVEVGSRAIRNEIKPTFVLSLETEDAVSGVKSHMLQTDFAVLERVSEQLTLAMNEGKNNHAHRIQRYVK